MIRRVYQKLMLSIKSNWTGGLCDGRTIFYLLSIHRVYRSCCFEVHYSPQAIARDREERESTTEPPLPPPPGPPDDEESQDDDEDDGCAADGGCAAEGEDENSLTPSNKAISSFKRHFKVAMGSENRHFYHRTYGSPALALVACETFQKQGNAILLEFDSNKRKPEPRREILLSAGCDQKFMKSSVPTQREALARRLVKGKVLSVETKVMAPIFEKVTQGLDNTGWKLITMDDKFKAVFEGGKHTVEKCLPSVTAAIDWLQSMSLAEKVRFLKVHALCIVQHSVYRIVLYSTIEHIF